MGEMTVPLVDRGNGRWGSSSPAWDHLINRESSGNPTITQQIIDVNSGGNEAEGLFQITPKTWRSNGGGDFAPSARLATPQQQAIVAARIFTRNPTGSDWGAGRLGRESAGDLKAGLVPLGAASIVPPQVSVPYGMPTGSNSGGYGNNGVRFPDWVYALGNAFGVKPSTYPGHQESDRNEAGYAPNPQHLNRGIDWAAPGAPDEVDRMQRFADYLFSIKGELEQVIWWNPQTNKRIGVAGGKDVTTTPYYDYPGGYDDHRDHVHTRQSHSLPLPGGAPAAVPPSKPAFTQIDRIGNGSSTRTRPPINWLLHTEEGNGTAESLAKFCDGSNNVSYHWTLRDGILARVVDTKNASWSVLSANAFTINLCFAGSFAGWTREQWLLRERDIEIAAYVAVQDCHAYGIPTDVIAPPYHEAAGISDHKYVTQQLGIGTHTDVGNQFPWDVFTGYVNKYAQTQTSGDDMALVPQDQWDRFYAAYMGDQDTLSPLRPPGAPVRANIAQYVRWSNGGTDFQDKVELAKMGHQPTLDLLNQLAVLTDPARQDDAALARNVLAAAQRAWAAPASTAVPAPAVEAVTVDNSVALAAQVAQLQAENAQVRAENADLKLAAMRAQAVVIPEPASVPAVPESKTAGDHAGQLIDSVKDWTDVAYSLDATGRNALQASLQVLALKNANGSEPA